jgi:hypothetical protein
MDFKKYFFGFAIFPENVTLLDSPIISSTELILFVITYFLLREFKIYRKQERSNAAANALNLLNSCIQDIKEIKNNPHIYTYEGYYPDEIPEIGSRDNKLQAFKERPSRLIFNRICKLEKDLGGSISKIAGKESKELNALLLELRKAANVIIGFIAEQVKEDKTRILSDQNINNHLEKSWEKIEDVKNKFEKILNPIIEG